MKPIVSCGVVEKNHPHLAAARVKRKARGDTFCLHIIGYLCCGWKIDDGFTPQLPLSFLRPRSTNVLTNSCFAQHSACHHEYSL